MTRRSFFKGLAAAAALTAVPFAWTYKKAKRVFTGARARLFINGKEVGYFKDVSYSIIDKNTQMPVEYIPSNGMYDPVELKMRIVRTAETDKFLKNLIKGEEES